MIINAVGSRNIFADSFCVFCLFVAALVPDQVKKELLQKIRKFLSEQQQS